MATTKKKKAPANIIITPNIRNNTAIQFNLPVSKYFTKARVVTYNKKAYIKAKSKKKACLNITATKVNMTTTLVPITLIPIILSGIVGPLIARKRQKKIVTERIAKMIFDAEIKKSLAIIFTYKY